MERIVSEDRDKWRPLQAGPCGREILENYASHVQSIIEGTMSVKDALDESAKYGNEVLDEYYSENE